MGFLVAARTDGLVCNTLRCIGGSCRELATQQLLLALVSRIPLLSWDAALCCVCDASDLRTEFSEDVLLHQSFICAFLSVPRGCSIVLKA